MKVKNTANSDKVLQQNAFLQRRSSYGAQFQNYEAHIAPHKPNLKTAQYEEAILVHRLDDMQLMKPCHSTLMAKKWFKAAFSASHDARLGVESTLACVRGSILDNWHRLDESPAEQKLFAEDFRRSAYQELVETIECTKLPLRSSRRPSCAGN
ncbi:MULTISPECIES: hypothetical protein [unclassified Bradyrhizobium]|uniref:hypothetical protein n=1 Tax=unclassified Bradyrhizobium TaxID=2631580 RepID=UPI001FF87FB3|nr:MULTISPECIES: hypothetical protein [unclassified Bradyrhizobium]MCK1535429.1 hypothetical protein [Bradyrhizobium sp. 176]MCK1558106.1 hypothetical protein [Bradyrhizobium sp. 171]